MKDSIKAGELRLGNWVERKITIPPLKELKYQQVTAEMIRDCQYYAHEWAFKPIPLSKEVLEKVKGIEKHPHLILSSAYSLPLGRNRYLSLNDCGTPNEIWFVSERDGKRVEAVITVRNYDYDGKSFVHHLQNMYYVVSGGKELEITL